MKKRAIDEPRAEYDLRSLLKGAERGKFAKTDQSVACDELRSEPLDDDVTKQSQK